MEVAHEREETYFLSSSRIPAEPSQLINEWELRAPGSWHFVNSALYAQRAQLLPRAQPCIGRIGEFVSNSTHSGQHVCTLLSQICMCKKWFQNSISKSIICSHGLCCCIYKWVASSIRDSCNWQVTCKFCSNITFY